MPGSRQLTSQFLGANLLVGGSAAFFMSLYYLLKTPTAAPPIAAQPTGTAPDVGVGMVVEDEPPSQYGFYKHIEYVGYFFTALGLFSAADLALQVFIPALYNETRWWVEVLLVTFGVLSYAIFGSVGRLGAEEEKRYVPSSQHATTTTSPPEPSPVPSQQTYPETLQVRISEFSKSSSGDFERQVGGSAYDMFRVMPENVVIWRESRQGMRTLYVAGPYELARKLMEEYVNRGEEWKIGYLSLSVDTMRDLLSLQEQPVVGLPPKAH